MAESAFELAGLDSVFYSGLCTGQPAFDMIDEIIIPLQKQVLLTVRQPMHYELKA